MTQTLQGGYLGEHEDRSFAETPFVETGYEHYERYEEPQHESAGGPAEAPVASDWHFETPFELGESLTYGEPPTAAPEVAALTELTAELKDHQFRESLEALATEALEAPSNSPASTAIANNATWQRSACSKATSRLYPCSWSPRPTASSSAWRATRPRR
ncbi:MAG: hypothetical protein JO352_17315 [Chloroflexi bacterium]|nr:hypothetical protein [Chloroflexota bacterium]MBV9599232.1 hypothetical protein [Chloroflexota bacterium]